MDLEHSVRLYLFSDYCFVVASDDPISGGGRAQENAGEGVDHYDELLPFNRSNGYANGYGHTNNGYANDSGNSALDLSDDSVQSYDAGEGQKAAIVLYRKAWLKFLDGCLSTVEDCRQIHAQPNSPFTAHNRNLLDSTVGTGNSARPKFRLDVWSSNFKIACTFVSTSMQMRASSRLWEEAYPSVSGLPSRTAQELDNAGRIHVANQPNPNAPDHHFVQQPLDQGHYFYQAANGGPLRQPFLPGPRDQLRIIRDLLHSWYDPVCRSNECQQWKDGGCGPATENMIPDLVLVATENGSNIEAPPGSANFSEVGSLKFKFPFLVVEIVGGKDEWSNRNTFCKVLREASLGLHFLPRTYFMIIYFTRIRFGVVTRNPAKGTLDVKEEFFDLSPKVFPLVSQGAPVPPFSESVGPVNGENPPAASDLSVKLQRLASRVINAILDLSSVQAISERACNDLRLLPNWTNPLPISDQACQNGDHRGFRPAMKDMVDITLNPRAPPGQVAYASVELGQDRRYTKRYMHSGPGLNVDKCNEQGTFFCHHLQSVEELMERVTSRNNPTRVEMDKLPRRGTPDQQERAVMNPNRTRLVPTYRPMQ